MKIGFVFDDSLDKSGGIQEYMESLRPWLTAQGHEVHYLVGQTERTDIPNIHSLSRNLSVKFNGNNLSISLLSSRKRLKAVLAAEKFDVLHVQVPYSPFLAGRLVKLAPASTVIFGTYHIAPYSKLVTLGARLQALACRGSLHRFDEIISVSTTAADFARKTSGLTTNVIPNSIDYPRFHSAEPLPQYDDQKLTILFLGRLVERKGCQRLLQAMVQVLASGNELPPLRVVICGAGPLEAELRDYTERHQLTDTVEFAGRVSEADKPRYYASADISVFPSNAGESFGIVLLEAMAKGRAAVLGGDNPGYRTVLGDRPEQLFATETPDALANKLVQLLQDANLRQQMAAWAAKKRPSTMCQRSVSGC